MHVLELSHRVDATHGEDFTIGWRLNEKVFGVYR